MSQTAHHTLEFLTQLEERDCGARQPFCQLVALMFPHSEADLNQLPQALCGTPPPGIRIFGQSSALISPTLDACQEQ
jgi:hypothetical protein